MLMIGCAPGPAQREPLVLGSSGTSADGGTPPAGGADAGPPPVADAGQSGVPDGGSSTTDAGSADAGPTGTGGTQAVLDRYCDPSIDAAAGIVITDSGACPGIMPAPPSCAAEVAFCPGGSPSTGGIFASAATSDAQGALAVACTSYSSGATLFRLGLAADRYAASVQLGEAATPLASGFVTTPVSRPAPVRIFAHDGAQLASVSPGGPAIVALPLGALVLSAEAQTGGFRLTAQLFGSDGVAKGPVQHLGDAAASSGAGLTGAADLGGATLVAWTTYAPFATFGRWLGADGTPQSPAFDISGWAGHASAVAALPGGGIAVGENDSAGVRWHGVLVPGTTSPAPVPAWLSSRGAFTLVRGGKAALFRGSEIVGAGGASCGFIQFADPLDAKAGADGTLFHPTLDGKSFRIYPQLLH